MSRDPMLITLQAGGPRPALFLLHAASGAVFPFIELARRLDPEQPCVGIEARGASGQREPQDRIEAMAAAYVEAILDAFPGGPYRIAGWSFGGVLAFEMGIQLHRAGQRAAIAALDTRGLLDKAAGAPMAAPDPIAVLVGFGAELGRLFEEDLGISAEELLALPRGARRGRVVDRAATLPRFGGDGEAVERLLGVFEANAAALAAYTPKPYPGSVTLFRASEASDLETNPTLGWDRWVRGKLDIQRVRGDHHTMMRPPQVDDLAAKVGAWLLRTGDGLG